MTFFGKSAPETDLWVVPARLVSVVDGDTIDVSADLGFFVSKQLRIRLLGVDTSEIFGVDKESDTYKEGIKHKQFTTDWLAAARSEDTSEYPLELLVTKEKGYYGRWLADVRRKSDDHSLVGDLIAEFGSEVEYDN